METGGCDCSLKELLMMGIIMPETCWAASMQLNNKFYDWLLHLVVCFIWILRLYFCLRYPTLIWHIFCVVSYCHLWAIWLYQIILRFIINGTIYGENITERKMLVLIFSINFVWNNF
jgi:hypothetical protein